MLNQQDMDEADGMIQEVDSKGRELLIETSG